jgi:hypothetical protein
MTTPSREHLLGYLLEALDPHDQEQVEAELEDNPALSEELARLELTLGRVGLRESAECYDPPPGLARRTCRFVARQASRIAEASPPAPQAVAAPFPRRFTWSDLVTLAAVLIAGVSLGLPAILSSRFQAQVYSCQNQLRLIGLGLHNFSDLDPEHNFPGPELDGPRSVAGVVAPILVNHKLVESPTFRCPSSAVARGTPVRMPTLAELDQLTGYDLRAMQRAMGGDYGYNMGYVSDGRLMRVRDARRVNYILGGDAPSDSLPRRISANHRGRGLNLLYEDGHIRLLKELPRPGLFDDPYHNRDGWVAAGVDADDAVLGASADVPLPIRLDSAP